MPLSHTYSNPGLTRHLRKEVEQLEACYQTALNKDEVFAVLKDIRDHIKVIDLKIIEIETAHLCFGPDKAHDLSPV